MGAISPLHLLIVLIVALVVIGPRKLPETGAALGKAIREFRDATRDELQPAAAVSQPVDATPVPAPAVVTPTIVDAAPIDQAPEA